LATSIRAHYSVRLRGIRGSRLYYKAPFDDEINLIEARYRDVNEQVNFGVYIRDLDKDEVEMLTMGERILFAAKL
jgi:hypothetical protein